MGIRLQGGFTSRKTSSVYVINIHDSSYSGSITDFDLAKDGLIEEYNHDDKGRNHVVLTSSVKMRMLIVNDTLRTFISDVVNSSEGRFLLEITKDGNKYWYGYILPDLFTLQDIPDGLNPVLTVKATDGIGRLKDIDYNNAGTRYTGKATFVEHLFNILGKIGFQSFYGATEDYLVTYVDWWDQNHTYAGTSDPWNLSRFDHRALTKVDNSGDVLYNSTFEVLEQICKAWNCRFLFSDGTYKLVQVNAYETDSSTKVIKVYDKNQGVTTTSTSDLAIWNKSTGNLNKYQAGTYGAYHNNGNFKYYPALREVEIQYEHFNTDNLIPGNVWNESSSETVTFNDIDFNDGNARLVFNSTLETRVTFSDPTTFQILTFLFQVQIKVGTYYLKRGFTFANGSPKYQDFEWTTTPSSVNVFSEYMNTFDVHRYIPVSFTSPLLQEGGQMDVTIIRNGAYNTSGQQVTSGFTASYNWINTSVRIFVEGNLTDQTNIKVYTATSDNGSGNSKTEEIPVLVGDGPSGNTFGSIEVYDGADWVSSTGWRKGNTGTYIAFGQLLANEILAGQKLAIERYLGDITGDFVAHGRLRRFAPSTTTNYVFIGGRHNLHTDVWEGEWFLIDVDTTGISTTPIRNYADPIRPGLDGSGTGINKTPKTFLGDIFPIEDINNPDVVTHDPEEDGPTQIDIDGSLVNGDTITTIPVNPIKEDGILLNGDVITIVTPTGEEVDVIVDGDVNAGDTTIDVVPVTPGVDVPDGSILQIPTVDLYAYVQRSRTKTLNFFSDIRVTDTIVDGNPLFFFRVDEQSLLYLNTAKNVEIQVYTPGTGGGQYDFELKAEGNNILSSTVSETTTISRATLDFPLISALYSFHVSNITGTIPTGVNFLLRYTEPLQKETFIPTDSTINGEYPGDVEAFAGGVKVAALYQMSVDNYHGLPRGLVIQNYSSYGFPSDAATGAAVDEWYALNSENVYGIKKGAIRANGFTGTDYADDAAAGVGGIAIGDPYTLSVANIYGVPAGFIKVRKT